MKKVVIVVANVLVLLLALYAVNEVSPGFQRIVIAILSLIYLGLDLTSKESAKLTATTHADTLQYIGAIYEHLTHERDDASRNAVAQIRTQLAERAFGLSVSSMTIGLFLVYAVYKILNPS